MIVAEQSPDVHKYVDKTSIGQIPVNLGSYHSEFTIVNYLGTNLCAIGFRNESVTIPIEPQQYVNNRFVEIRYRNYLGRRSVDHMGRETTVAQQQVMCISYDMLRREPVFVEEINAVLCFPDQVANTLHPHSEQAVLERAQKLTDELGQDAEGSPIVVLANDPTGQIDELFIEINGEICSVNVSHVKGEDDFINLGIRNKPYKTRNHTVHRSFFWKLKEESPDHIWTLGGYRFCSNREWLVRRIEMEREKIPETLPLVQVTKMMDEARVVDREIITNKNEEIKLLGEENKLLKRNDKIKDQTIKDRDEAISVLKNGSYDGQRADLDLQKLNVDRKKVENDKATQDDKPRERQFNRETQEAERKARLKEEKIKRWKEGFSAVIHVAKSAPVWIPVCMAVCTIVGGAIVKLRTK